MKLAIRIFAAAGRVLRLTFMGILLALLAVYRKLISPLLGPRCRFHPSCSAYAQQALHVHGPARGSVLAVRRVLRCHPYHPGGLDPVPQAAGAGATSAPVPSQAPANIKAKG